MVEVNAGAFFDADAGEREMTPVAVSMCGQRFSCWPRESLQGVTAVSEFAAAGDFTLGALRAFLARMAWPQESEDRLVRLLDDPEAAVSVPMLFATATWLVETFLTPDAEMADAVASGRAVDMVDAAAQKKKRKKEAVRG
jgi:hypothetical protein